MWIFKKVKAGALQYVLVISVVIALIVFAFIQLIHLQQRVNIKNIFFKEAVRNVQEGFDYLHDTKVDYGESQVQLSSNQQEQTSFNKKHWGVFDLVTITSKVKNEIFQKSAIVGNHNPKQNALYLKENNMPLIVVGNTKITGNASLPKQGVNTGNISGNSYYNNLLIYGRQKLSSTSLPAVKNLSYLKTMRTSVFTNASDSYFELEEGLEKEQSFSEKTLYTIANAFLNVRDVTLKGNIILCSNTKIKVSNSAVLEDVILVAPVIEIAANTKGTFQAIASQELKVGKGCQLNYPSALVVISKENKVSATNQKPPLFIDSKSKIKGVVLFNADDIKKSNFNQQVVISKDVEVKGEVFCNRNLELLGTVIGSVYTNKFITKQFGSTYVNHLYNAIINRKKLSNQYAGMLIENQQQKVAKWVQ
ncbi:hypothetical protein [Tenacibaculum sp. M341]|uniref:hypothetical protein n=1 Tax=Tenacibaculum sp. M341 TaxID=2530339 RepID=UPI001047B8CC|nr:hypothetical protein [Tenacibaculum sp. M341]TCI85578.1 hypothetical protein EYW44_16600 [Tenacibaculum sp. M341]